MKLGPLPRPDDFASPYAALCAEMLASAVRDARGRRDTIHWGVAARRTEQKRARLERQHRQRIAEARSWLAGEGVGLSVYVCCDGTGFDYETFRSRLVRAGDLDAEAA